MTDRMTLDEARRLLATAWDHGVGQGEPQRLLALLDHLAARVEAGEAMAESCLRLLMHKRTHPTAAEEQDHRDARAALARWEGLSK